MLEHVLENIPDFYKPYVTRVKFETPVEALFQDFEDICALFNQLTPEQQEYRYAEGKWTPKQIVQHVMDSERILSQRALRFSRKDMTQLPGFDHDAYVEVADVSHRTMAELIEEFRTVRQSTILLYKSFTEKMLKREGFANGMVLSVENQGLVIAGHLLHHVNVLKERYLV
ncbi:MAG: DinB family protein [Bacteroidia bacterium]|nr:DinB family protein [Bacteroidia bacterium]